MDYFISQLPNRRQNTNVDHLPIKMQLTYLKQQNQYLKKSLLQQQRLVINFVKDNKGLQNKVAWLEQNRIDLVKQIENLEIIVKDMQNKLINLEPISSISVKTLPRPQGLTNLLKQSSIFSSGNITMKKQIAKNTQSTIKYMTRRRFETQINPLNQGISVKVINSQTKRSVSKDPRINTKQLKTLRSVGSSGNLYQTSTTKSNFINIQKMEIVQPSKPSKRKMSYIQKISNSQIDLQKKQ